MNIQTYSQYGEDLLIAGIACAMGLTEFRYLDVGANHPVVLSNTFLFYEAGYRGVLVEPDPSYCDLLRAQRPGDVCIQAGAAWGNTRSADFYRMTAGTLSTFSESELENYSSEAGVEVWGEQRVEEKLTIPLVDLNEVIAEHFGSGPEFVSIDTEGLDLAVLKSIDLELYAPSMVCIETRGGHMECGASAFSDYMGTHDYRAVADTGLNTIFARDWEHGGVDRFDP